MSENQSSFILIIIAAILSGFGGYFTRRVQKYEDTRDDAHLKILPALHFLIESFLKSHEIFKAKEDFDDFKSKVEEIIPKLGEKISSGEALIARVDTKYLVGFYWGLQHLKVQLDEIKGNSTRIKDLLNAFDKGNEEYKGWLKVNPKDLLDQATIINNDIENRIRSYKSISILVIILIIIVAVIVGVTGIVNEIASSQVPLTSSNSTSA